MKRITILCTLLIALTLSCGKRELGNEEVQDCKSVPCTYELRWISVKLVDQSGNPVALERMKVTRLADGKELTRTYDSSQWAAFRRLGSYPVSGDLDREHIPKFKHTKLRFQGYIGKREVVKADYVVTFDCCHISLVSGDVELVVHR
ncbi:hypothetical protein GCM10007415_34790 [Parapedobacter pyrenivorans]|uniref:Lipoprotein n=1 Tax=Parapedobacter pyrenivorans TaxID=1305674 RepID=A0A917HYJ4_9SPHI|nr:hypothetical protein [Parapedobacter pyrenivorans]GGG96610.1 hypothetical protein GCM10007415_34790 [Parapedobacter pyrenivorans]